VGHPWPVGTRVRLREGLAPALSGRTGTVVKQVFSPSGYHVLHDCDDAGPFGWGYEELELLGVEEPSGWDSWPLTPPDSEV
jgi:hypothetical protein